MELQTTGNWKDYELIDSGDLEKLERFGKYILSRPEPQAVWRKSKPETEWSKLFHARFTRKKGKEPVRAEAGEKGEWIRRKEMPDQWKIGYSYKEMKLVFRLGLTSFGHIGIFPEQAINWDWVYDRVLLSPRVKVLNLFAYTGGTSFAAKSGGADVVHVDSVKPVISWARENMELNGLQDIRWVVEDALKFARREVKRENKYDGIILDPPAYGRGPEGEKWILQDSIEELMKLSHNLLSPGGFLILSLYSLGFSALISENLALSAFPNIDRMESGELYFPDAMGRRLPLGTYLRIITRR